MALAKKVLNAYVNKPPVMLVYAAGFVPAVYYFYLGVMDQLGADPLKVLEKALGLWALRLLLLTLTVTMLREALGLNLLKYRRAFGLLAFYYAGLHLTVYLVLDRGADWNTIWVDVVKRPYITLGMIAFLTLVPLAATSSNFAIRRLGSLRWRQLHRLVYLALPLAAIHFILLVKSWPAEPLIYAALAALVLIYRVLAPNGKRSAKRVKSTPVGHAGDAESSAGAPVGTQGVAPNTTRRL